MAASIRERNSPRLHRQLHGKIQRDCGGAYAALRSRHNDGSSELVPSDTALTDDASRDSASNPRPPAATNKHTQRGSLSNRCMSNATQNSIPALND
jgi:hypothetical protein